MMTLHKEGKATIGLTSVVVVLLNGLSYSYLRPASELAFWVLLAIMVVFWLFILSFFRVPKRTLTQGEGLVICPADGKVVVIEEVVDQEYFKGKRLQVSIFMSPANVHQNRNPVSGEVVYSQYHKGKYLVAWDPKSSTDNERHTVVIRSSHGDVLVKQIAGALARRIVNYLQPGQQAVQSEEYGFIKFGSRVDVLLPLTAVPNVVLGQQVKGGVTVLASFKE
jgi:phosphatidylserine decarboxylase